MGEEECSPLLGDIKANLVGSSRFKKKSFVIIRIDVQFQDRVVALLPSLDGAHAFQQKQADPFLH